MGKGLMSLPGPEDVLRKVLPNGITILVRENFASPSVVINGYLVVGSEDDPPGHEGLANLTVDVMERGTDRRPFEVLYEEVESVGASFGLSAGFHTTSFGGKGLAEQLPLLLDICSDVIRNPAFAQDQIEHARAERLSAMREMDFDTRTRAAKAFRQLTYPTDHPYHRPVSGTPEIVASLNRDELIAFHRGYFAPDQMVLSIVGAVDPRATLDAVDRAFDEWRVERPSGGPLSQVHPPAGPVRHYVPLPDKTQTDLVLGWPGPARKEPDFLACNVANTILGVFGMMGRLGEQVRSRGGLAYYAYSSLDGGIGPGPWRAAAGVHPLQVEKAIALILDEVRQLRDVPVPAEELEANQSYLTGSLPLGLETNEGVASMLTYIERHQLGMDYLQKYKRLITEITADDIQSAAQRWLNPDAYALGLSGPPQA